MVNRTRRRWARFSGVIRPARCHSTSGVASYRLPSEKGRDAAPTWVEPRQGPVRVGHPSDLAYTHYHAVRRPEGADPGGGEEQPAQPGHATSVHVTPCPAPQIAESPVQYPSPLNVVKRNSTLTNMGPLAGVTP